MGTGTTKRLSRHSGQERENKKTLPAVWEREFNAFLLENIREQEFPLMPDILGNFVTKIYLSHMI